MQTNTRAIVAAAVALIIILVKNFVPQIAEQLDLIANPLVDIIVILLSAYAGLNTATATQVANAQKVV